MNLKSIKSQQEIFQNLNHLVERASKLKSIRLLHVIFNIKFQSSAKTRAKKKKKCRPYLVLIISRERLVNNNNLNVFSTANKLLIVHYEKSFWISVKNMRNFLTKAGGISISVKFFVHFIKPESPGILLTCDKYTALIRAFKRWTHFKSLQFGALREVISRILQKST